VRDALNLDVHRLGLHRALAGPFVSDLTDFMGSDRVTVWIRGHTHRRVDIAVRGTRVVSIRAAGR
jgi:hypothetical protein